MLDPHNVRPTDFVQTKMAPQFKVPRKVKMTPQYNLAMFKMAPQCILAVS